MSINRHNYEEYFILYMDNELGEQDRQAVEAFVQLHPDLNEELELLLQFKMEPDTSVVFNGKEELLMVNGETPISLSNYEEWMMLYTDNELDAPQQLKFEQFMIAHPSLQQEFDQLKKARFEPETIMFAGKASLYRKEERVRRLPVWWRVAAAAVLLISISITALIVINRNNHVKNNGVAGKIVPEIKTNPNSPVINDPAPARENIAVNTDQDEKIKPAVPPAKEKNIAVNNPARLKKEKTNDIIVPQEVKEEQIGVVQKNNDLPKPLNNPNITNNKTNTDIANHSPSEYTRPNNSLTKQDVTTGDPNSSNIKTAVNKIPDPEPDPELDTDAKKNKSRGLFRKIARTFEKRTDIDPTDDNRLLVAGLAIKLK